MSAAASDERAPARVRVAMPGQLRTLAQVSGEVVLELDEPVTIGTALDTLEAEHPTLVGAIRDRGTGQRRPMIRFYADGDDFTDASPETPLPSAVVEGREPLRLVGAIAGG